MTETVHGVLLNVDGAGVLLLGEASVGKSECALELLSRGHRLVADDVVIIERRGNSIMGSAPERFAGLIEIRDLGVFDVRQVFDKSAFAAETGLDLCIELRKSAAGEERDRIGADTESIEFMGMLLPKLYLKVERGRNVAVLVETAVRLFKCAENNAELDLIREHDNLISLV